MEDVTLYQGDCFEYFRQIPDDSVDLVLTDPPYNMGVATVKNGKAIVNSWDKIDDYINWSLKWLSECARVLKPQGVLYFFHNDIEALAEILHEVRLRTPLVFVSFCVWNKGNGYRAQSWHDRRGGLRSWFPVCEYCLHFFNTNPGEAMWGKTGLDRILSNPACFAPLKKWYAEEKERLGLTNRDIARHYTEVTGKPPYMLRHYFQDSQFEIPTREVYDGVYKTLGFRKEYEELRKEYEELRKEYEELRNVHNVDPMHCNVWHIPPLPSTGRFHTCQKPVPLLRRLIRVSSPEGGVVFDPFMGSGSTGVACRNTGRKFIGCELDPEYFATAKNRIENGDLCLPSL